MDIRDPINKKWRYPQDAITSEDQIEILRKELENTFTLWDGRQTIRKQGDTIQIAKLTSELCDRALQLHAIALRKPCTSSNQPSLPHQDEPLQHMDQTRMHWESSVADEVHQLAKDTNQPLFRKLQVGQ